MALDEAILEAVGEGSSFPTLRLYAWDPPCLSLGFGQSIQDVDMGRLVAREWEIVRRPTGGRAILHTDELTYAVQAPIDHPHLRQDVLSSYRYLSDGLIQGVENLGIQTSAQPKGKSTPSESEDPVCFVAPNAYEITSGGKKLLGSAQVRRKSALLQHGTLPLYGDLSRICEVLVYEDDAAREDAARVVHERATTVEQILGRQITWESAARAMVEGFTQALGIEFTESQPTSQELQRAEELLAEQYASPAWTERI